MCQSPKLKESLAQGLSTHSRNQEKTLEEELEESLGRGGGGVEGNDLVYLREGFWGGGGV